jgi:uncharacterized membrane protein YhaH (DUF805 family)
MSTIQYYIHFLKNAFNFTGRASIEQFFSVIVANFAANLFLTVFAFLLRITGTNLEFIFKIFQIPLFIFWIYSLIAFLICYFIAIPVLMETWESHYQLLGSIIGYHIQLTEQILP